ncbi:hypothetical protein KEM54_001709 [Ascosphaera aggregata]|nr:hypothetical protein KEM54_001709 [Ascosphaera aggregata]
MSDSSGIGSSDGQRRTRPQSAIHAALRITLTAEEYEVLHRHLFERATSDILSRASHPSQFRQIVAHQYSYRDAALRDSLRIFIASALAVKLLEKVVRKVKKGTLQSANLRSEDAQSFRERNPRVSCVLTSRYTPAIGASLAGFALGVLPEGAARSYAALWLFVRALEATYNALNAKGCIFQKRPWWFGSWILMPISMAQLFHSFVFDRDTVPGGLSAQRQWPASTEIVDSLAYLAKLKWPAFTSPILHPLHPQPLPSGIENIAPITSPAHPSIPSLSCALLHPKSTSCLNVGVQQNLLIVPQLGKILLKIHFIIALFKLEGLLRHPLKTINGLCIDIVARTVLISTVISAAWGSICLFNNYFPRRFIPAQRFYLSGVLAGLPFAALGQDHRSLFLYFFRLAISSCWEAGKKRKVFRAVKNGDIFIISASWAVLSILLNGRPKAVSGASFRKALAWCQGNSFVDPVAVLRERSKKRKDSTEKE